MNRLVSLLALVALLTALVPSSGPVLAQSGSPDYGASVFLLGNPATTARDIALVKKANLNWIKIAVPWRSIEPSCKNCIDWDDLDRVVLAASQAGLKILARVDHQPDWSRVTKVSNGPPDDVFDYADFVSVMAKRYQDGIREGHDRRDRGLERAEPGPRVGRRDDRPGAGVPVHAHAQRDVHDGQGGGPDQDHRQRRPLADRHQRRHGPAGRRLPRLALRGGPGEVLRRDRRPRGGVLVAGGRDRLEPGHALADALVRLLPARRAASRDHGPERRLRQADLAAGVRLDHGQGEPASTPGSP